MPLPPRSLPLVCLLSSVRSWSPLSRPPEEAVGAELQAMDLLPALSAIFWTFPGFTRDLSPQSPWYGGWGERGTLKPRGSWQLSPHSELRPERGETPSLGLGLVPSAAALSDIGAPCRPGRPGGQPETTGLMEGQTAEGDRWEEAGRASGPGPGQESRRLMGRPAPQPSGLV